MDTEQTSDGDWFYEEGGQRKGPVSESQMIELIRFGRITYGTLVWKKGFPEWLKLENTALNTHLHSAVPPPIAGRHINNTLIWVLAFAPILGMLLENIIAHTLNDGGMADAAFHANSYWFVTLALNIGLSYLDEHRLKRAGWDTSRFSGWTWLVPVYLFQRAKNLNQGKAYFITWIVCFVLDLMIQ
ncbi:DUF4339 domain-containing protein [Dyella jejuensis]|uniref:DUF4339 domain-containing protein n=2 Tax=Dyella jejuensis TaxID=1432009 RepID=A0ABW8JGH8_9GAMM